MMHIVYFSQKERLLAEIQNFAEEKVFVTPSPAKADGLRSRIEGVGGQDVVTIAKFTADLIQALWKSEPPQIKRKADLLLIFGILKNKYLPDLGFEQFMQAYNLFSDLRSFTLNEEALGAVLDEQPEEIVQAVRLFWLLLKVTGFEDEHGAYQKISEALRSHEEIEELKKTFIFWGFQHLNGQQVDLLKALAIRYEVIIPFPFELKEKIKRSDWISWLKEDKVKELDLSASAAKPKAQWVSVNSRELSLHLKECLLEGDQVVLGVSKLSPSELNLVPSGKVSFKIPHNLIENELAEVASYMLDSLEGEGTLETLKVKILGLKSEVIKQKKFKSLRAVQLYDEALSLIQSLSDEEVKVDVFFLKLLNEVVRLNQPRTSFIPLSSTELSIDLKDMSSLDDVDRSRRVLVCIDDRFEDIQGLGQNYPESIQKALSTLGPLKRNELELLYRQWEFEDLFSHTDVTVLMSLPHQAML